MIKTTSYEISKELERLGFENLENANVRLDQGKYKGFYLCYDLETILDSLPAFIQSKNETHVYYRKLEYNDLYYRSLEDLWRYRSEFIEGESLADTAARLLIKLIKDKIINIKSCQI